MIFVIRKKNSLDLMVSVDNERNQESVGGKIRPMVGLGRVGTVTVGPAGPGLGAGCDIVVGSMP